MGLIYVGHKDTNRCCLKFREDPNTDESPNNLIHCRPLRYLSSYPRTTIVLGSAVSRYHRPWEAVILGATAPPPTWPLSSCCTKAPHRSAAPPP
jgi:hypothetical protein